MRTKLNPVCTAVASLWVWLLASGTLAAQPATVEDPQPWGPETPRFNLQVVLRGDGFGLPVRPSRVRPASLLSQRLQFALQALQLRPPLQG